MAPNWDTCNYCLKGKEWLKSSSSIACKPAQPKAPHPIQLAMACLWTLIYNSYVPVMCFMILSGLPLSKFLLLVGIIGYFVKVFRLIFFSIVGSLTVDNIEIDLYFDSCQVTDRRTFLLMTDSC